MHTHLDTEPATSVTREGREGYGPNQDLNLLLLDPEHCETDLTSSSQRKEQNIPKVKEKNTFFNWRKQLNVQVILKWCLFPGNWQMIRGQG